MQGLLEKRDLRPWIGMSAATGAAFVFSLNDALGKILSLGLDPIQVAWLRYGIYMAVILAIAVGENGLASFRTKFPFLQLHRAILAVLSAVLFLTGLKSTSLVNATGINLISPILIILIAAVALRERVSLVTAVGCLIAFAGAAVILKPSVHASSGDLWILASATTWSIASVMTRRLRDDPPLTTLLWSSMIGFLGLSCLLPWHWSDTTAWSGALACSLGLGTCLVNWLVIVAYRMAPAGTIAPFTYLQVVGSVILGLLLFSEIPDALALIGISLIVVGGACSSQGEMLQTLLRTKAHDKGQKLNSVGELTT